MAAPVRKISAESNAQPDSPVEVGATFKPGEASVNFGGSANHSHVPSPALELLSQLEAALAEEIAPPPVQKWSGRRSIAFTVGISLALWAGMIAGARVVLFH